MKELLCGLFIFFAADSSYAHSSRFWLDYPVDGVWQNANNWEDGLIADTTAIRAAFGPSSVTAISVDAPLSIQRFTFVSAPSYTFSGATVSMLVQAPETQQVIITSAPVPSSAITFNNALSIAMTEVSTYTAATIDLAVGSILVFNGGLTTTGLGLSLPTSGTIYVDGPAAANIDGSLTIAANANLGGNGTINLTGGVIIQGALRPGGRGVAVGETLTINGNLSLSSTGIIEFGIGGTTAGSFDRIIGVNSFTANGTVLLRAIGSFNSMTLTAGASFDLIDWAGGSVGGPVVFDVTQAPLASGLVWDFSDFSTTGVVKVVVPLPNLATDGIASASANQSGWEAPNAFDGNTASRWSNGFGGGPTDWLRYQFGGGGSQVINQYRLTSASDAPERDPKNWQFQGSNDGVNWITLSTESNVTFAARLQTKTFAANNTTAYAYYRLNITASFGGGGVLHLAEFGLYLAATPLAAPQSLAATPGNAGVTLSWGAVAGALSYTVKRSQISGGPYSTIFSGLATAGYADTGLTNGQTYHYVVSAVNAGGESPDSTQASATPIGPAQLIPPQIAISGLTVEFSMQSVTGRNYQLQHSDLLDVGPWIDIGAIQPGTGGVLAFEAPFDPLLPFRFYRIEVRP